MARIKVKLYVIEWIHSKTENAFLTDMKNLIFDLTQQNYQTIDLMIAYSSPLKTDKKTWSMDCMELKLENTMFFLIFNMARTCIWTG